MNHIYPQNLPQPGESWTHIGHDAEVAGIHAMTVPIVFFDKQDYPVFVFQKFVGQKPVHTNLVGDLLAVPGTRVFLVIYKSDPSGVRPLRLQKLGFDGKPRSDQAINQIQLMAWFRKEGRLKPGRS